MKSKQVSKEQSYDLIAMAIVRQAAVDYRTEYLRSKRLGKPTNELEALEYWFTHGFGKLCCMDNGDYIMQKIRSDCSITEMFEELDGEDCD